MLVISYLAYLVGPFLFFLCTRFRNGINLFEGFVVVAISGLCFSHLLNFISHHNIFLISGLVLLGIYLPNIFERIFAKVQRDIHSVIVWMVIAAFLVHVFLEASVLSQADEHHFTALHSGILIHRIPDGMMIWWLLRPKFGNRLATIGIILLMICNLAGFYVGEHYQLNSDFRDYLELLMTGALLHVVFFAFHLDSHLNSEHAGHHHHHEHQPAPKTKARGVGSILGLIFVGAFFLHAQDDAHGHHQTGNHSLFIENCLDLFYDTAPALLVAFFLSGLIQVSFTVKAISWFNGGSRLVQVLKGLILGIPLTICSCGILPFYQTLIKKGLAPAAALAFLIATPELGIDSVFISLPLLGKELTVIRLVVALVIAIFVGLFLSPLIKLRSSKLSVVEDQDTGHSLNKFQRFWNFSTKEIVDDIAPVMMLGILIAAVVKIVLVDYNLSNYQGWDVIFAALTGVILFVCASGSTPIAAVFLAAGASPGAIISFLITGPAAHLTTYTILSKLHGRKFALIYGLAVLGLAITAGLITNQLVEPSNLKIVAPGHVHEVRVWWEHIAVVITAILFIYSILRRSFINQSTTGEIVD